MSRTLRARSVVALICGHWIAIAAVGGCSQNKPAPRGIREGGDAAAPGSGGSGATATGGTQGTGATGIVIGGSSSGGAGGGVSACEGLECQKTTCTVGACLETACAGGEVTSISGSVYDPAGKVPLYNVMVYVPNGEVMPFTDGASCDRCGFTVQSPVASALTDTAGNFVIQDVPVGANIPLVIQIGKWRRQLTIPAVTRCVDTPLTNIDETRLPKNKTEGDIPLIAIATGGADSLECLPRRMGIEDAEFTNGTGDGRIHLFRGAPNGQSQPTVALTSGAALSDASDLLADSAALTKYDILILSCEGDELEDLKPPASRQAVYDYASIGGRVFASHFHHIWFSGGPTPLPEVGTFSNREDPQDPAIGIINQAFPKGADFASWLVNVGASTTVGELSIAAPRDNMQVVNTTYATEWIGLAQNQQCSEGCDNDDDACIADCTANPRAVQYVSFNTPLEVPEEEKCGRMVYTDLHVSATPGGTACMEDADCTAGLRCEEGACADNPGASFPDGCEVRDLTSQEKAVAFMLFDLSSCVQDDDDPPEPPPVPK
ncbi:MAG TPA: carboxypeptidase regulatory-like domain-containing protein [Polyangiaceae bacterium]|nr:carboxypeptidase regulatory-like domain-containing protein [Polyangiaceae bacterium]